MPRTRQTDARPEVIAGDGYVLVRADVFRELLSTVGMTVRLAAISAQAHEAALAKGLLTIMRYWYASILVANACAAAPVARPDAEAAKGAT